MFSLDVLTLVILLHDIYMLLFDTCLYHLTSNVLPPNTWHATTWHLPLLWYHLSPATCHVNTWPM